MLETCAACGSPKIHALGWILDAEWVRCRECGSLSKGETDDAVTVARALPCWRREDAQEFLDVRTETYRFVAGRLANELSPGSRVLDFGCSFGGLLGELEARGLAGLGVDVNPECVSFVADNGLSVVESGSLQEIAGVGEFDAVCLLDIVMYLPSEITELKEVRRLLRPDGILIIRTTNKRWLATAAHVLRRFHGPTSDDDVYGGSSY